MFEVVYGQTKKKFIADRLVNAVEPLNLHGTLYIGYPVIASADEPFTVDGLLVSKEHGVVAFALEPSLPPVDEQEPWRKLKDEQDRVYFALQAHLAKYESLRKGRQLGFDVNTLTIVPVLSEIPRGVDLQVADVPTLPRKLQSFVPLPADYEIPLNAALQRVSTLRPAKKRASVTTTESRGGVLRRLEQEIANLDQWQKAAAIGSPEGPQRIRGIAGSGKTVVLALKAAYLHAQNPEWTIAVTFYSRSLYQQFTDLIRRFAFEQAGDEPDWSKLRVMHAWGARDMPGMYLEMASRAHVSPKDFLYAKSKYGRDSSFSGVCEELLASVSEQNIEPLYDAVLIDEGQDLPGAFFRLVHQFTREPKRLIWAYDELQNLSEAATPPPEVLFGTDASGNPRVRLFNANGQARQDVILPVCYRNTPWALTLAHALGFGIYRKKGLVQHFDDPALWHDVGYSVLDGELAPGSRVTLQRRPGSYPPYFSELLDPDDAVVRMKFDSELAQAEWVAHAIEDNLKKDELEADDILVVLPNALTAKSVASVLSEPLARRGIQSHLAGVTRSQDRIFYKHSVALANIFRSKGNEAPMVYVLNSHECVHGYEQTKLRNTLFTAITRCRAWIRLCGVGPSMDSLIGEIDDVRNHQFKLEFSIPTEAQLEKMRTIHRELTAAERVKIEKAEKGLKEFLEAVQRGDLPLESLPMDLRTKLARIMGSLGAAEDDES
jgi:superfamily I DNA and RNA helicase